MLQVEEYDDDSATCRACLTVPTRAPVSRPVTRNRVATRPAPAEPQPTGPRAPLRGVAGSGDLEVRERRARRAAQEALAASHPEEYALLLRDARAAEGLRPS